MTAGPDVVLVPHELEQPFDLVLLGRGPAGDGELQLSIHVKSKLPATSAPLPMSIFVTVHTKAKAPRSSQRTDLNATLDGK